MTAPADRASSLLINGRFLTQPQTGVQRAAREISIRLSGQNHLIQPRGPLPGPLGHAWEQTALALQATGGRLWSPCNSGPILARRHAVTIHDAAVLDHPEWFSPRFVALYRWLWPQLAKRARIITVSAYSRQRLAERLGLSESDITVVPNGVGAQFAPASADAIARARRHFGLDDRPYFMTLSTLEPRKNIGLALRAWKVAAAQLGDARLLVLGAQGAAEVFASVGETEAPPGVIFTGRARDDILPALMSGSRGLIYPSLYEGFGLPLLEGMACGAPVITTRLTSLPEVGGEAALYVDAHDSPHLASTMVKLLESDELVRMRGAMGIIRAAQFSWARATLAMHGLLNAL
jgi:glycosyltransferase involved in cell wall biosynthesis